MTPLKWFPLGTFSFVPQAFDPCDETAAAAPPAAEITTMNRPSATRVRVTRTPLPTCARFIRSPFRLVPHHPGPKHGRRRRRTERRSPQAARYRILNEVPRTSGVPVTALIGAPVGGAHERCAPPAAMLPTPNSEVLTRMASLLSPERLIT